MNLGQPEHVEIIGAPVWQSLFHQSTINQRALCTLTADLLHVASYVPFIKYKVTPDDKENFS